MAEFMIAKDYEFNFRDRVYSIANLLFDKPTYCNAVFMIASKKADAVFSQKVPSCFN